MNLAELLIDESIDQVLALNTSFEVIVWNKACEAATGIEKSEITGRSIFTFFPEMRQDNGTMNALHAALNGYKSFVPYNKSLPGVYAEKHFIPIKDEKGNVMSILNVIHNVAHRIKAEQELLALNESLEEYQKSIEVLNDELTVKNRLLASVNSELKTFTNIAVTNYSETLRQLYLHFEYITANEAGKLSDPGKANIRKAQAAIQKMKLLTNDIIAFTRLNEFDTEMCDIDLNAVLKTIVNDLNENISATGAKITIEDLPHIQGYPFLVSLMFHHLLENAMKFRRDKVTPQIQIFAERPVKGKEINNHAAQHGATYQVITVMDNGIGFEEQEAENIFQIFTRLHSTKYKGSGIGLAICRKAMELHNGFIVTESVPGEGSLFRCYFPIVNIAPPYPVA